jgi:hypothetical protein
MLTEDSYFLDAEDLHQLQRAWHIHHRSTNGSAMLPRTLLREVPSQMPGPSYGFYFPRDVR